MPFRLGAARRLLSLFAVLASFLPALAAVGEARFDRNAPGAHVEEQGAVHAAAHPLHCELCRALSQRPAPAAAAAAGEASEREATPASATPARPVRADARRPSARAPPRS
jgi:hypothetical protein